MASPDVNGVLSYNTQRTGRRKHRLASLAQPGTTFRRTDCCIVVSWNCFLGHLLKFAKDRGTTIHCVLFGGISHHQCKRRHRKNKEQFHRVTFAAPRLVSTDVSDVTLWHPPVVR